MFNALSWQTLKSMQISFDKRFDWQCKHHFSTNIWIHIYNQFSSCQIKQIVNTDKDYLNVVCRKLQISECSDENFAFLREFLTCLQPIAETITVLEGDILYGHTLPALFTIQNNFEEIRNDGLVYALPLLNALEDGFEKRYNEFLNPFNATAAPYFLAMVSHPSYKLDCVPGQKERATKIYKLLLSEAQELSKQNTNLFSVATTTDIHMQGTVSNQQNNPKSIRLAFRSLDMIILFTDSLPKIHRFFVKKWLGTSNLLCVHFKFFIARRCRLLYCCLHAILRIFYMWSIHHF